MTADGRDICRPVDRTRQGARVGDKGPDERMLCRKTRSPVGTRVGFVRLFPSLDKELMWSLKATISPMYPTQRSWASVLFRPKRHRLTITVK